MDTATNPNIGIPIMQRGSIIGYATSLSCANCGTLTPVRAMLRDRCTGEYHCTDCPGEDWLRRTYGDDAAAELVALRQGLPGAPSLAELRALYPERPGRPRLPKCPRGHLFTPENTYQRRDGRRACRACATAYKRLRREQRVAA